MPATKIGSSMPLGSAIRALKILPKHNPRGLGQVPASRRSGGQTAQNMSNNTRRSGNQRPRLRVRIGAKIATR
jgi:hypothetical protein